MTTIRIGTIEAGDDRPVAIIAEAACEHLGSLEVAMRIADAAKWAGADIVKFQYHLPEEMLPGSIRFWGGSMDDVIRNYNLTHEDQRRLLSYCEGIGIQYLCTPFSISAADRLEELGVAAFKTGSGEMTNHPMQRHIARKRKPMIVSTGMATIDEISATVMALKNEGVEFMLMHCTSEYPPRYEDINLRFIPRMREMFGVLVGHSDHTPEIWTALGAVAVGAVAVEKHFTLDRRLGGPDHHISLEPDELRTLVDAVRKLEAALGSEKRVHPGEESVRAWAHHSVVSLVPIPQGTVLGPQHLGVKRPGGGIPASRLTQVFGRVAAVDIAADRLVREADLAAASSTRDS